jgi:hypothetical protein
MPPINSDSGLEHKYQTLSAVFAQLRSAALRRVIEIALVLVRLDHVASVIVNANHGIV